MSPKYFVDTNVLIYAHDRAGEKRERARHLLENLWNSGQGVLSTQVLQEVCVNLRRLKRPIEMAEICGVIQDYLTWEIITNSATSVAEAMEIEARFKISFWDALVIQAATEAGAAVVFSEDLNDGQKYGRVKVINPFTSEFGFPGHKIFAR